MATTFASPAAMLGGGGSSGGGSSSDAAFDAAMARLKQLVYRRRIRLSEFFVDFDPLRRGTVTPAQFSRALSSALERMLPPAEVAALSGRYARPDGRFGVLVNHAAFVADVDAIFVTRGLEGDPFAAAAPDGADGAAADSELAAAATAGGGLVDPRRHERAARVLEPPERQAQLEAAVARVRADLARRGALLRPFCEAMQRGRGVVGHLSRTHFSQALSSAGVTVVSPAELRLIAEAYVHQEAASPSPASSPSPLGDMVDYLAFTAQVDPPPFDYQQDA